MSQLNKDVLFLLFEELRDDSKSLFSCLLVNKLWCETVIPILWRNPWCYDIDYESKSYLFAIIASYLSVETKEFLLRQGINFPSISYQSLLFDYLSFCRSINVTIINNIIPIESPHNQFYLQQEFYNILITSCTELKYLDMRSINHQIFYIPKAKACLETLYELKCDTSVDPIYFYGLARICQNIQKLVIINDTIKVNHGIAKLIEAQENLKNFEWEDEFYDDDFIEDPYEETLLALKDKADILIHLKIFFKYIEGFDHTLLQEILPKFYKLKTLILKNDFTYFNENQFKMLVYHDIEILHIDYITINMPSYIIENSGGHLKEIILFENCEYYEDFGDNFNEVSLKFIQKICEHCPSIEYLTLAFAPTDEHFTEFKKLLKVCQKLKSLLLMILNFDENETTENFMENGAELLKALIRSAPTNLREIRFFDDFKFSLDALEEFLKQWEGRPALSILTIDQIYRGEDYKRLINKFKNDGVIIDFRVVSGFEIYY
ncbi:hypothetical protein C1645_831843 [Glomus cerebriforme]|uniref:F-box domain-containing protein n=1 Tax=Glomus cerebriforme TaxID=658196 RepID=A0A397SPF4_9GLOM|nr:hypothetical protein C1645_831843 [Glomus cerebriforme]